MALTDAKLRTLKGRAAAFKLSDAEGLQILIAPGGSRLWRFAYTNGGHQVSYETIDGIQHSMVGDHVRLCLVSVPDHCPPGDDRGRVYHVTNLRTQEEWSAADAEHECGGA